MNLSIQVLKKAFQLWRHDNISTLSASLAFFTVFSLAPLLLLAISVAGIFFGEISAQQQITSQIRGLLGNNAASVMQKTLKSINKPETNIISGMIGFIILVLGAAGVFNELKKSLNRIWKVSTAPHQDLLDMMRDRIISGAMILVLGFLLLMSLIITTIISVMSVYFKPYLPLNIGFIQLINLLFSLVFITFLFGLINKVLPDVNLDWKYIWPGAITTAVLFVLGKEIIAFYIGHASAISYYGAAGSLVIILLWVYYGAQILFFGTEVIRSIYITGNLEIHPKLNAQIEKRHDDSISYLLELTGLITVEVLIKIFAKIFGRVRKH